MDLTFQYKILYIFVHFYSPILSQNLPDETITTTTDLIQPSITDLDNVSTTTVSTTETSLPVCFLPDTTNVVTSRLIECQPCICDKKNDSCQINCCCDPQCSKDDKLTFSKCVNFLPMLNRRECFRKDIFFALNLNSTLLHTSDGLYCVEPVNSSRSCYAKFRPLNDDTAFQKLGYKTNLTARAEDVDLSYIDGKWQAGKPIVAVTENENYFIMGLAQGPNKWCFLSGTFLYLFEAEKHCQHTIYSNQTCLENIYLNAATFYKNFDILQNTTITVSIQPYLCNYMLDNCVHEYYIAVPFFNNESQTCENVVTNIQYTFTHRGIYGITKAEVKLVIRKKKLLETFDQKLKLVYRWDEDYSKSGNETNVTVKVSGNPGYLLGKPVLAGNLVNDSIKFNSSRHLIFPSRHKSTFCNKSRKINFGENLVIGCVIPISTANLEQMCDVLRNETTKLMRLAVDSVGSFGNSTPSDLTNWVPIRSHTIRRKSTSDASLIPSSAICTNVTLSYHLMLSHASVGHKALSQSKIVGAHIVRINSDYFFLCVGLINCKSRIHYYVNVRFAVTFVNVTKT